MGMPKIEVTIGIGDDAKIWIAEGMTVFVVVFSWIPYVINTIVPVV